MLPPLQRNTTPPLQVQDCTFRSQLRQQGLSTARGSPACLTAASTTILQQAALMQQLLRAQELQQMSRTLLALGVLSI
jgi:hypothetical protein